MKKDNYLKNVFRTLFSNKGRFLGNFAVSLLSVLITSGLGVLPNAFKESYLKNYEVQKVPDIILTSKAKTGFTQEQIDKILTYPELESAETLLSMDTELEGKYYRFYIRDFQNGKMDIPNLTQGKMPSNKGEVLALSGNNVRDNLKIGDKFTFPTMSLFSLTDITVVGLGESPLYAHNGGNRVRLEDESNKSNVAAIFYVDKRYVYSFLDKWKSDIYISLPTQHKYMTPEYKHEMERKRDALVEYIGGKEKAVGLTLEENESYALYSNYTDKIRLISYIFPLFFILVGALVNSITVNRLVQDERLQIGTFVSLGEPKHWIIGKYTAFSCVSVGVGALVGYFAGASALPPVVLPAYASVFRMHGMVWDFFSIVGIFTFLALFLLAYVITALTVWLYLNEKPARLLHEKAPKPGKRILLERIGFIWKHLSFSIKSMFRNIFRLKKNFILTSLAVGGSTLLVFVGFSLLNVSDALVNDELFKTVASSMGTISTTIIMLAVAMAVVIVYLLANMNIEERKREIATLKVLGYHENQCCMYCFREIGLVAALASLISLPIDAYITSWVFTFLGFGSLSDVKWWSYVLSFVVILLATAIVNLLLIHRISKIDTTTSLQTTE